MLWNKNREVQQGKENWGFCTREEIVSQATILRTMDTLMAGLMIMDMVDKGMAGLIEKLDT